MLSFASLKNVFFIFVVANDNVPKIVNMILQIIKERYKYMELLLFSSRTLGHRAVVSSNTTYDRN